LADLAQRITQQESELESLRRELEARQAKLADLNRRKEELASQLQEVQAQIRAITAGNAEPPATPQAAPAPQPARAMRLGDLILALVEEGGGQPVAVRRLALEVRRRKFPTTSGNLANLVKTRVGELVRQGLLRRVPGRLGVILGQAKNGATAGPRQTAKPKAKRKAPAKGPKPTGKTGQPPLREVLVSVLKKSRRPLTSGQLAAEALAAGYQTQSKDFATVVSVVLSKMPGLEHVPRQGFRLKKG
jgi:hypothetical protein